MSPSRFHEPPTATPGRSLNVCGGPPDTSIFLSLPPASHATNLPSGDQKGGGTGRALGTSEPRRGRASSEFMSRIQSRATPSEARPKNAMWRPSGDTPKFPGPADSTVGGIWNRVGPTTVGCSRRRWSATGASVSSSNAAIAHATHSRVRRAARGLGPTAFAEAEASDKASSANARSLAVWNRAAGLFSRQRSTMRRRAGGIARPVPPRSGGSSLRIAVIVSAGVSRRNARRPDRSSYKTTPSANRSAR
jgi:hypothetical protein